MMYCPGWEVVGAKPGERFLFRTVQRRLGGWRVHSIMYYPDGKMKLEIFLIPLTNQSQSNRLHRFSICQNTIQTYRHDCNRVCQFLATKEMQNTSIRKNILGTNCIFLTLKRNKKIGLEQAVCC